ncbi:MAG: hypothetical protein A3H69_02175 [Candidatus Sungbacteria bacterium RIFCSPLOWO2_02_FULL_47_9]|uniref:Uncharacterized protein n=1 Tax=Candidatus Sungbacteria bacterium RIFCSPHIGHO2_01_FULL_47_32 TaxID=1802264 RepID=A0A1G2K499_9BACT|nr:MAG: hypothetical protein UX72_C0001G0017 [Parcubacteria group bacterium GW2011_GWA2_47_10]OGZ94242.1 MAG: hypothetical protein A2633_05520 [Candidatus Sungbacteria bacterium RIFCSPHIGHO2_01_FULL_47_32]OHA05883.1 MAG: hypothetical protein A3A28_02650 [Candidatus Sungbacteria bacterium RIFCSPLOWO2_01_FULL_47_32]OHA08617.1 MAG: hypothetical protein A3H69_02175 [Candidatus Sungbacteria bacterium RIFCSPLOWO2_02_FULL_47_9]
MAKKKAEKRSMTNFEKWRAGQYREAPAFKKRVAKLVRQMKRDQVDILRILSDMLDDFLEDEKFRKLIERKVAFERAFEKNVLAAKKEMEKGKGVPYEFVKIRLGL